MLNHGCTEVKAVLRMKQRLQVDADVLCVCAATPGLNPGNPRAETLHDPLVHGETGRRGTGGDVKLAVDAIKMGIDSPWAEEQRVRNLSVGQA